MSAPQLVFTAATAVFEDVYAGLPGGYFVTDAGAADRLALYAATAPATRLGLVVTETNSLHTAQNTAGAAYMTAYFNATNTYLAEISAPGGTLTVGTVGTFAHVPSRTRYLSLSHDGTEVAVYNQTNTKFLVLSTADASVVADTTLTGHTDTWIVAAAGSGRVVGTDSVAGAFELWDGPTDTLLDTYSWPSLMKGANPKNIRPVGTDLLAFAMLRDDSADPQTYWVGVLSTAGNVLSTVWDQVVTTNWAESTVVQGVVAAGDGYFVLLPGPAHDGSAASLYAFDAATGSLRATAPSTDVGTGTEQENSAVIAGPWLVYYDTDSPNCTRVWSVIFPPAGPFLLRQRQSPKRTPSRVRGVDLRARQTPFIR